MRPVEFIAAVGRGKLAAAYFLRGPDRFLHEECRAAMIASLPPETREWCLAEVEFSPGRLARELEGARQLPMLGGRNLLLFSDPEDFKQVEEEDYDALAAYLERPSPFTTVAFSAVEPDRRRRLIQLLEKRTQVVDIAPLAVREAAAWLKEYLHRAGVETDLKVAEEIVVKFESGGEGRSEARSAGVNLLGVRTETEKLLTAHPGIHRLERQHLDVLVPFREEHTIGKLLAAMAEKNFGEALGHLRTLLASKEPEMLLLWSIGELFRQALRSAPGENRFRFRPRSFEGRGARPSGQGRWPQAGQPFSTFELAPQVLSTYKPEEMLRALRLVREADLRIKSSWKDSRILFESLLWQVMVGKGSAGAADSSVESPASTAEE